MEAIKAAKAKRDLERQLKPLRRVSTYHDLKWSRQLWRAAAVEMSKTTLLCLLLYATAFYFLLGVADNYGGVKGWCDATHLPRVFARHTFEQLVILLHPTRKQNVSVFPRGVCAGTSCRQR